MKVKYRQMYEVRYWPSATAYSKAVGWKGRLLAFRTARAVAARLKAAKVQAFIFPMRVAV